MKKNGLGFMTIAMGHEKYIEQARILSLSLRRNMPEIPLAIVTDCQNLAASADIIIPAASEIPVGVMQKVFLDEYTPFNETLFIDSDCVVTRPFLKELEQIRKFEFTPAMEKFTPANGQDEYIDSLPATLKLIGGDKFPKFNGGIYFFKDGELSSLVFRTAREIHRNYRRYGIRAFDKSGPGEETVFALALSKLGLFDLYHDEGNLMRTPTGLKGKIFIDPLGGGCTFERYDGVVCPAICHFAGPYLLSVEYRLAAYSLKHNISMNEIGARIRAWARASSIFDKSRKYLEYKIHGVRKRLNHRFGVLPIS
jgi:hypothetical protein